MCRHMKKKENRRKEEERDEDNVINWKEKVFLLEKLEGITLMPARLIKRADSTFSLPN